MNVKNATVEELKYEIIATKRLLNDRFISPPRKRDLTKYLWKLERELRGRG